MNNIGEIIPLAGMLTGIIIPLAIFLWLYHENKNKYAAVVEISKNLDDPSKVEELIKISDTKFFEKVGFGYQYPPILYNTKCLFYLD